MNLTLDPRLAAESFLVTSLPLCQVLLRNESRLPWLIMVPQGHGLLDYCDLTADEQQQLAVEMDLICRVIKAIFKPDKLNIGMLGNVVPMLHVHIIGRFHNDPFWPGAAWGTPPLPYETEKAEKYVQTLQRTFLENPLS